eukprot:g7747.t1
MTTAQLRAHVARTLNATLDRVRVDVVQNHSSNGVNAVVKIEVFAPPDAVGGVRGWLHSSAFSSGVLQRTGASSIAQVADAEVDAWRGVCDRGFVRTVGASGALSCTACSKRQTFCPDVGHVGSPAVVGRGNYSVVSRVTTAELDAATGMPKEVEVSVAQMPCEAGHYCTAAEIQPCPEGTYQDESSAESCKACVAPFFGNATGLTSPTCSGVCPPRHECIEGKLSSVCGDSLVVSDRARCASCRSTEFAFHSGLYPQWATEISGADACVECPHVSDGEAKCDGGILEFRGGYWHSGITWTDRREQTILKHATKESLVTFSDKKPRSTIAFYPCPCKECCQVENRTGTVTCTPGNRGALCAVCAENHFQRKGTGPCLPCDELDVSVDGPWIALAVLVAFVLLFLGSDARAEWRVMKAAQRKIQGCRRHFVSKSKIVLSFYQVVLLSGTVYRVPFPSKFVSFLDNLAFLRFELFKLVPISCYYQYSFHDVLDATAFVSFLLTIPLWAKVLQEYIGVGWHRCCGAQERARTRSRAGSVVGKLATRTATLINTFITSLLVITYLMYPAISSLLFQSFSCETIHLGRYLHQDYSIDCDSAKHKTYERLAKAMIALFAIGVPVLFFVLLRRHRHNLNGAEAQYLSFFYGDYRPAFWYWEVIECFRKLTLTGVALFFGEQGSLLQTAIAMGLVILYIPVLVKMQPYALPSDNDVAELVNVGLLFVMFSALLLKVKMSFSSVGRFQAGYTEDTLGYLLILVAVIVLIAWLVSLVEDVRRFNLSESFRFKASGVLLTMPVLEPPREMYHAFISHSQQDGGDQVANLKKELEKYIGTINIFTDVAAGKQERALAEKSQLYSAIDRSSVFIVFLTKTFFTRKVRRSLPVFPQPCSPCRF